MQHKDLKRTTPAPVFDADRNYRDRLASVVLAMLDHKHAMSDSRRSEMEMLLTRRVREGDDPQSPPVARSHSVRHEELSALLARHPDVQSRLALLTQYTTSKWMLEWEFKCRGYIDRKDESTDPYETAKTVRPVGVCLSGGGIRSATFNLGILQSLARLKKLGQIDYLSTVSGGGYIHQFLAAWISREGLTTVQKKLDPIPAAGSGRVIPPEPIRWLRRYSNYLSPSISLMGADVWTIASVWLRNTLLNLVVLISAIMTLMLVPHAATTEFALTAHRLGGLPARIAIFVLMAGCALYPAALLWYSFPRFCAKPKSDATKPSRDCGKDSTKAWHPYGIVLAWLLVCACVAPVTYRLSVPDGTDDSPRYTQQPATPVVSGQFVVQTSGNSTTGQWILCKENAAACSSGPAPAQSRMQSAWEFRPRCAVPRWISFAHFPCHPIQTAYSAHGLLPGNVTSLAQESSLLWLYEVFPFFCIVFCGAIWFGHKENLGGAAKLFACLCPLAGGVFSVALLFAVEYLFFVATFSVRPNLIPALGITLLPPALLAVPFISLELCTGLMGRMLGSVQREWVARLRAVSFQVGVLWFAVTGLSLLGPYVFELVKHMVVLKYAVWGTWAASTISGVLLGKSRSTNGKPREAGDAADSKSGSGWSLQEVIVRIAPPIFAIGLFILVASFTVFLLHGSGEDAFREPTLRWAFLLATVAVLCGLFSWRIDINEFSMNSFYRDRLARCYAGASNPDRQPNQFTGFDVQDGALRVASLLPSEWRDLEEQEPGDYEGPFPIFCTGLNLTTGKDLAYQERKAASFAITPLFSGYSTGWTDGMDCSMHYNGYVPTIRHVKAPKGMTVASAVAISGAAASPNMGFHSSTAMAFLMTIFNVRLGWWIRNPRRKAPDYPAIGLWQILKEMGGSTNDTSPFVYLSDGGHFENMGLHELLRRRCRTIIVCDAEADGELNFEGIGMAIRKARLDFGIEVEINRVIGAPKPSDKSGKGAQPQSNAPAQTNAPLSAGTPPVVGNDSVADAAGPDQEHPSGAEGLLDFKHFPGNLFHALEGDIRYPEDGPGDAPGKLLYIKSTLTGDEPADILNYHRVHPSFPFDTTLNQFFTESQFESYRRLGEHIVCGPEVQSWIEKNISAKVSGLNQTAPARPTDTH